MKKFIKWLFGKRVRNCGWCKHSIERPNPEKKWPWTLSYCHCDKFYHVDRCAYRRKFWSMCAPWAKYFEWGGQP